MEQKQDKKQHDRQSRSITPSEIPLFDSIRDRDIHDLLDCLHSYRRKYKKDEFIHLDQDNIQNIGVVLKGTVSMMKEDSHGKHTLMTFMTAGELVGETFALRKETRTSVSYISSTDTEILFLSVHHVLHPCRNGCLFHQKLTGNLFDLVSEKNARLMEKIEIISQNTLRGKITVFLSMQSKKQNSNYITIALSRAEMADYLCTNRSALSRELSSMRQEGLLDYDKSTFTLKRSLSRPEDH